MYGLSRCPHFRLSTLITGSTVYVLNDTHRFDKTNLSLRQVVAKFLNQVHAGLWPAHAWFLEIAFVWEVDMPRPVCLCVCSPGY